MTGQMHGDAFAAAEAAACAAEQGRFWPMRDALFENSRNLTREGFLDAARAAGVRPAPFERCLAAHAHAAEVRADMKVASSVRLSGTPAFFVGRPEKGSLVGVRFNAQWLVRDPGAPRISVSKAAEFELFTGP